MSNIVIDESRILQLEEDRVTLRNNLRSQGIACADDETLDSLASKVANIQSYNKLLTKSISGELYDTTTTSIISNQFNSCVDITKVTMTALTSIEANAFANCNSLLEINLPELTTCNGGTFIQCSALKKANVPKVTQKINFDGCTSLEEIILPAFTYSGTNDFIRNCSSAKVIYMPLYNGAQNLGGYLNSLEILALGSNTGNYGGSSNVLYIADNGKCSNMDWLSTNAKPNLEYVVLRNDVSMATLSGTNRFSQSKFATVGGKLFVPSTMVSSYQSGTNWSSLAGLNVIDIVGSRFESIYWYADLNSTCTLDGVTKKVLDNETVAIFKHTENISHCYENGVELQDTDLVKGKTLTSTV